MNNINLPKNIGTNEQYRWLYTVIKIIILLNLLDIIFTLTWVTIGITYEANPLLDFLIEDYPILFVAVKTILVGLGSILLWHYRNMRLAVIASFIIFIIYYGLLIYHLTFLKFFF